MSGNSCIFCQEKFPTQPKLTEHLNACGKKTDQCPNCKKYVKRAVFAYHYENNCAELEGFESEERPAKPKSAPPVSNIIKCEFCNIDCARKDYATHKIYCQHNPENVHNTRNSNQNHDNTDIFYIPCEFCNKDIEGREYEAHQTTCSSNPNNRPQPKERNRHQSETFTVTCEHCHRQFEQGMFVYHQNNCHFNSRNSGNQFSNQSNGNNGAASISCQYCRARIDHRHLRDHELACKQELDMVNNQNRETNRNKRPYWCQFCQKTFGEQQQLLEHLRYCDDKKPRDRTYAEVTCDSDHMLY